eukprot:TRINITY_DN2569_c0_g1_i1.p1 TRINITY_DN2569_c0_g1~~TRINITY_DN2569_c0_g1_i1.p1  ORF type:complete len:242 (-),score=88.93 TRINITY_DN2569_c0_g1_i1:542-1267(-)
MKFDTDNNAITKIPTQNYCEEDDEDVEEVDRSQKLEEETTVTKKLSLAEFLFGKHKDDLDPTNLVLTPTAREWLSSSFPTKSVINPGKSKGILDISGIGSGGSDDPRLAIVPYVGLEQMMIDYLRKVFQIQPNNSSDDHHFVMEEIEECQVDDDDNNNINNNNDNEMDVTDNDRRTSTTPNSANIVFEQHDENVMPIKFSEYFTGSDKNNNRCSEEEDFYHQHHHHRHLKTGSSPECFVKF